MYMCMQEKLAVGPGSGCATCGLHMSYICQGVLVAWN